MGRRPGDEGATDAGVYRIAIVSTRAPFDTVKHGFADVVGEMRPHLPED